MDASPYFDRSMTNPRYRTTVSLSPKARKRLDQLVEETDRSIREVIQSGIHLKHEEVIQK